MEQNQQNRDEIEIDLREVLGVLLGKLGIIILSGVLIGLLALLGTKLLIAPQYDSTTKIVVLSRQNNEILTSSDMQTSTLLTKDYAEIIKSRPVVESVIAEMQLDSTYEKLLKKISVNTPTDTRIISITVRDEDPYQARDLVNEVRDIAAKQIQQVMDTEAINVVAEANIPDTPSSPNLIKNGLIGGILGVILAVVIILIVYISNDTIRTQEDVERYLGLSTLGVIPLAQDEKKAKKSKGKRRKK